MTIFLSGILGLAAIVIPIRAVSPGRIGNGYHYVVLSLGACAIAIQLQIFSILSRMSLGETVVFGPVIFWAILLTVVTLASNGWSFHRKKIWNYEEKLKELEAEQQRLLATVKGKKPKKKKK